MLHVFAQKIATRWTLKNIISSSNYEWIVYGIEIILISIVGTFNIILIGIITRTFFNALIFLFVFILLRQFTGGFHANTCAKCNIYFAITYLINLLICYILGDKFLSINTLWLVFITGIIGFTVIMYKCPVISIKKPRAFSYKKINLMLSIIVFLIFNITSFFTVKYRTTINITLLEVLFLVLIARKEKVK